ncbi:MAG: hypothetical protein FWC93_04335 [Defluviitaleaceae bacterium]|nr:hypothetical protein [Defluviitaleaceae bacterium]
MSADELHEVETRLKERIAIVKELSAEAKRAEEIASLHSGQVDAVDKILDAKFEGLKKKGARVFGMAFLSISFAWLLVRLFRFCFFHNQQNSDAVTTKTLHHTPNSSSQIKSGIICSRRPVVAHDTSECRGWRALLCRGGFHIRPQEKSWIKSGMTNLCRALNVML